MTVLQLAEELFDEAERAERAGDLAALAERNADAEAHYERARACRQQANSLLEQVLRQRANWRATG